MDTLYSVDREIVKVGDIVMLNDWVGCSADCGCGLKKLPKFLKRNTKYIVKGLTHFGGGCPPEFLKLENVPETWDWGLNRQWFTVVTKNTVI